MERTANKLPSPNSSATVGQNALRNVITWERMAVKFSRGLWFLEAAADPEDALQRNQNIFFSSRNCLQKKTQLSWEQQHGSLTLQYLCGFGAVHWTGLGSRSRGRLLLSTKLFGSEISHMTISSPKTIFGSTVHATSVTAKIRTRTRIRAGFAAKWPTESKVMVDFFFFCFSDMELIMDSNAWERIKIINYCQILVK